MVTAPKVDVAVVVPVYNEQDCIEATIQAWVTVLEDLGLSFRLWLLDDGSRDGTATILDGLATPPRVTVLHKVNEGHGPTVLSGYRMAAPGARWIFQADADSEIHPSCFTELWNRRQGADAVLGIRRGPRDGRAREILSAGACTAVRLLFGSGIPDVNVPFRLMESSLLEELARQIPPRTFAPNVILSGALVRSRARIRTVPVPFSPRPRGVSGLGGMRLLRIATRAMRETLFCRPRVQITHRSGPGALQPEEN